MPPPFLNVANFTPAEAQGIISMARNLWRREATGVTVRVFYVDRDGASVRSLAPQQLLSAPNAATVEAIAQGQPRSMSEVRCWRLCPALCCRPLMSPARPLLPSSDERQKGRYADLEVSCFRRDQLEGINRTLIDLIVSVSSMMTLPL